MKSSHRKLCRRFDIVGDVHFITFSCYQRLPLLSRSRSCQWVLQALQQGRERELYDLWAYVVMPEHVHLVLYPRPHTLIRDVLKSIKQSVSRRALQWLENNNSQFLTRLAHVNAAGVKSHRFWQRGGGYDRNLRSIADVHEKIAYCHNNPIRRGLVDRASSWQWSSALAWETGRNEPIAIDRELVPRLH